MMTLMMSLITVSKQAQTHESVNILMPSQMETMDEDEAYLSNLLGIPVPEPAEKNASPNKSTSSLVKSLFATLSRRERRHVFEAYKFDFLLFGYTYNEEDYA